MSAGEPSARFWTEMTLEESLGLLSTHQVGRLCVIENNYPLAFPVNYRLVPNVDGGTAIVVRTRPGSVLDQDEVRVGFEVDGIDESTETGWSVVVRGTLHRAETITTPAWLRSWDPRPWIGPRDSWLYVTPIEITGRRLVASVIEWAVSIRGYL